VLQRSAYGANLFDPNVQIDSTLLAEKLKNAQPFSDGLIIYRVQLGAFSKQIDTKFFGMVDVVMLPGKDGLFKYLTVDNETFEKAHVLRKDMVATGFEDAFVVAYKDGERVTLESIGIQLDESGDRIDHEAGEGAIHEEDQAHKEKNALEFKIQIIASKEPIYLAPANFKGLENVGEYSENGLYKYTSGSSNDFGYANSVLLNQLRRRGYKDAFVVVFLNGERISLEKAFEIINRE